MVPLIVSHDGAVHRDTIRRWKDFAPDIKVDWVRMGQNVLHYNVVNVGKFFNGSWTSEAWRKAHPEEHETDSDGPSGKILTTDERRELLHLDPDSESTVCVCAVLGHATSTWGSVDVRLKGTPEPIRILGPISQLN